MELGHPDSGYRLQPSPGALPSSELSSHCSYPSQIQDLSMQGEGHFQPHWVNSPAFTFAISAKLVSNQTGTMMTPIVVNYSLWSKYYISWLGKVSAWPCFLFIQIAWRAIWPFFISKCMIQWISVTFVIIFCLLVYKLSILKLSWKKKYCIKMSHLKINWINTNCYLELDLR